MTPTRFLILLAVVVLLLFGISIVVAQHQNGQRADPGKSRFAALNSWFAARQKIDVLKDLRSDCLEGTRLLIPKFRDICTVKVLPNSAERESDRPIRNVELWLSGTDTMQVHYRPSPADPEAVAVDHNELKPVRDSRQKPLKLVFMRHGGELSIRRNSALADAAIEIRQAWIQS
jgi:hypothetical protein